MVPKGWKLTTLDKVCNGNLKTGPFGSQLHAHEYTEEGVPVLMPRDLINYRANIETAAKISPERAAELSQHKLKKGDILFSRRGDVTRFALIDESSEGAICGTGCLKARPSSEHSSLFLSYFLQKNAIKKWLENSAVGQTMPNMNTAILSELPLMAASSKVEEEKIAKTLSTWDQAIKTTEKLLANSQQQKSALMQELLMGRKRFIPFINSEDHFQAKYGLLPSDWSFLPLSALAKEVVERNSSGTKLPVLSCSKHRGFVDSLEYFKKQVFGEDTTNYKIIEYGSFGFPSNHIEEGSIGYQNICEKGMVSPIYTVFKTNEKIDDSFLYKILKTDHYRQIFAASTNASVDRRGSLRWKEFSTIRVPVPSLEEQKEIASIIDDADREVENYQRQLANLQIQKKALMQQLLTGKRRVKVDES
jgi:type I restriction enzyme S subunit